MAISPTSRQARNNCVYGYFELVEKIVCKHFNSKFHCKTLQCILTCIKSNRNEIKNKNP